MLFVQFRVHPAVGCARIGNSDTAYHLASEFPYFLQEAFPNLRFKPKPRVHPKKFFGDNTVENISPPGALADYVIYEPTVAFKDKFKEAEGKIFPQGVRFRVFAYVYNDELSDKLRPQKVFEVRSGMADITWKVNIANKKSKKSPDTDPHENSTSTSSDLDTTNTDLVCKRIRPVAGLPNLAYIFLERDDGDKSKLTGRLHVIGNEGEFVHPPAPGGLPGSLWSDDWYDSAGDGSVQAIVKPTDGGEKLRELAGASSIADLKYLNYGASDPQAGSAASITALPGWVVVGPPDYVPDMGHFVSLWDVALDRGFYNLDSGLIASQPGKHMLIESSSSDGLEYYKHTDYLIHIHPQLCLFDDVKFVSGEAFGDPENRQTPSDGRAHGIHPTFPGGPPPAPTASEAIKRGGMLIGARANKTALMDPTKLKNTGAGRPLSAWLKVAIVSRLRKPHTLYDKKRKFVTVDPSETGDGTPKDDVYPRKLGRRMDYDQRPDGTFGPDKNQFYTFPHYRRHRGNLLNFHGLPHAGSLCGGTSSPPTVGPSGATLSSADLELLKWIDDMYWPATFSDMPMLRELAYTPHQYEQFKGWQAPGRDIRSIDVFVKIVPPALKAAFNRPDDADNYFLLLLLESPTYAPTIVDMAHLGTMLGGSFLPGIEVGREAGIARNWCLFHGATPHFPSIRFKPFTREAEHSLGTLTKDLAIPWSEDFKACDESFWPTSRPGRTTKDGVARQNWQITHNKPIPHLGQDSVTGAALAEAADAARRAASADPTNTALEAAAEAAEDAAARYKLEFVKEYWKALGFIRRDAGDVFKEQEQSWH